uniref:E3 ubiquitin-protein ligase n=1 Tax=Eptatretus burgeri TaxID=7764 RepID=A0A8C4QSN3_EPTBU
MSGLHGLGFSNGVSRSLPAQRFHRGWNMSRMNKQLLNFFRCSLCPEYLLPPIIKCMYGHMVCITCRSKFTRCAICWGPMSGDRNLSREKLAEVVRFPCRYAFSGCQMRMLYTDKPDHEDLCEFHPYPCPCPSSSCRWQGQLEAMVPHLQDEHKFITELEEEETRIVVEKIELGDAQDWVRMQFCFGFHFLLVLTKQGESNGRDQLFAIVILIGTRKQAEHFTYHVKLVGHR